MLLKLGVDMSRLNPEIRRALRVIENCYADDDDEGVLSSTYEGNHYPSSLHYHNDAVDTTGRHKQNHNAVASIIAHALGPDYDVVPESDHIHTEYDPK